MQDDSFDFALGRAALEASDPGLAHWVAGVAAQAERRAASLIDSGQLSSFESCLAGVSKRRVPPREDALFRDGTNLVQLKRNEPWEAAELAERGLRDGEAWICLRLVQRIHSGGGNMVWACVRVLESDQGGFDAFWSRCAMELARAEVQAVGDLAARGYFKQRLGELGDLKERALSLMERDGLGQAVPQALRSQDPSTRL